MVIVSAYDLVDPNDPQGRTWKQINSEKTHTIPVGALVEYPETGVRLFVVYQGRDCDRTPLYWLSADKEDTDPNAIARRWNGGYSEESLVVIRNA